VVNQGQFLLHVGYRLSVTVSLIKVRAEQIKEKAIACDEMFTPVVEPMELASRQKVGDL